MGRRKGILPTGMLVRLRSLLERRLERHEIRFACLAVLGMSVTLLVIAFWTSDGRRTVFGPDLGADFAGLYTAGTLLNEYPSERLYDLDLQDELYHRLLPHLAPEVKLPYLYPPFLTVLFRPLALLPYPWAYLVWLLFSIGLCLAGIVVMRLMLPAIPRQEWSLILLLMLSFEPLVLECLFGGQTSALGFFVLAVALYCDHRGARAGTGLALAFCLYKPPLLLLILPLMAVARRWQVLAGFGMGALGLAGVSVLVVGWRACLDYVRLLIGFGQFSHSGQWGFPSSKFVDLNSFFDLLLGGRSVSTSLLLLSAVLIALLFLGRAWWRFNRSGNDFQKLVWASAVTWTLVLNIYTAVYDTVLAVHGMLLTADALYSREKDARQALTPAFRSLLFLLYCVPWVSQLLARAVGFQPYTLVLAAIGAYQLVLAQRSTPVGEP